MIFSDFAGKKILVVGLGKSGLAATKLLVSKRSLIAVYDEGGKKNLIKQVSVISKKIKFFDKISDASQHNYDLVIVSPGIPWNHKLLELLRKRKMKMIPEFEFGLSFVNPKKIIAITGTNGKTTTTALIGHLIKSVGEKVIVAGNIGTPLSSITHKISNQHILVLEVSSYQLEAHCSFHPHVGVWLNMTPDHLLRHKTMKNYSEIKLRLFINQSPRDFAVLNSNDLIIKKLAGKIKAQKKWFPNNESMGLAQSLKLPGGHNTDNAMASILAVQSVGLKKNDIEAGLKSFKGVAHRLQFIAKKKGVNYINDSKATNVDSTKMALRAVETKVILILGGEHKGTSYKVLIPDMKNKVTQIISIGQAAGIIKKDLGAYFRIHQSKILKKAVQDASLIAQPGETVLFSPACASFDQFKNFEDRGNKFSALVRQLK